MPEQRKRSRKTYLLNANPHEFKFRKEVLETGEFSDVSFLVGGHKKRVFKAHRFILMAGSKVFREMLKNHKEDKEIVVHGVHHADFQQMLK